MDRRPYSGSVRNSLVESERDARILVLAESGLAASQISQRMGLSVSSVRNRLKRARLQRARSDEALSAMISHPLSTEGGGR